MEQTTITGIVAMVRDESVKLLVAGAGGWLMKRAQGGGTKALAEQNRRIEQYLGKFARRLASVERRLQDDTVLQERVATVLEDPDFWALHEAALVAATRTQEDVKQEVLARAIEERLFAEPDSAEALIQSLAVEITPKLTTAQLGYLAVAALITAIRPPLPTKLPTPAFSRGDRFDSDAVAAAVRRHHAEFNELKAQLEEVESMFVGWLHQIDMHTGWTTLNSADLSHLVSVRCLVPNASGMVSDLRDMICVGRGLAEQDGYLTMGRWLQEFIGRSDLGGVLLDIWRASMGRYTLSPAGAYIGVAVHDVRFGSQTTLDLRNPFFVRPAHPVRGFVM